MTNNKKTQTGKKRRTHSQEFWHQFRKNKGAMIGIVILVVLLFISIFGDYIWDYKQVVTKVTGLRMQVLDYLGDTNGAQIEMRQYQRVMSDFFKKSLPGRGYSASVLIHLNYPYTEENRDCWFQLSQELQPVLTMEQSNYNKHIYLVSVEEENDVGE